MIYPEKLTLAHAAALAPRVRKADLDDLKNHGAGADYALAMALTTPGEAWAVMHDGVPIGAGGWTKDGCIWTLWADLSLGQAREVMKMVVPYARIIAIRANRPLHNWYREGNRATEHFLRATRCVDFTEKRATITGRPYRHFKLKALEDLPNV